MGVSLIGGRFVYTVENKPISAGREKTGAYVDENSKLDAMFCVKGSQEFAESNASSPKAQLQRLRMCLSVIARRTWNFRAMGASRAFLRSEPLKRDTYVKLLQWAEKDNVARKLLKPLYGLGTACKDWYRAIRNFRACECGWEVTSIDKSVFLRTQQGFGYG